MDEARQPLCPERQGKPALADVHLAPEVLRDDRLVLAGMALPFVPRPDKVEPVVEQLADQPFVTLRCCRAILERYRATLVAHFRLTHIEDCSPWLTRI